MTARTHDIIAFASLMSVAAYFPPGELNVMTGSAAIVGNVVGALVPDMDQATNRLWDLLPVGNFFGNIFRNLMLHHRTISHSILGGFIFYKLLNFAVPKFLNPAYVNANIVVASIMIGFISHVAADMVTKEGVPLFFPLPFKIGFPPFEALRITTGKFVEKFIVFPGVIAYIVWLVANKKEELLSLIKLIHS
jgi:inner membrane protein